jgi:acetyltransferase-like isoleucine patch superfamily enzyme
VKTVRARLNSIVRQRVWKMDIHPSARIAATALIDRTWPKGVHIGAGCVVEEEAVVLTHDLTRGLYLDTYLEDGVYLGPRAIVLPGVRVGRNSVVRAGAVVIRDVPEGTTVQGNPAKPIDEGS